MDIDDDSAQEFPLSTYVSYPFQLPHLCVIQSKVFVAIAGCHYKHSHEQNGQTIGRELGKYTGGGETDVECLRGLSTLSCVTKWITGISHEDGIVGVGILL